MTRSAWTTIDFGGSVWTSRTIWSLHDQALLVLGGLAALREEGGASGMLEHLPHAVGGLGRAFEVLVCTNLPSDLLALLSELEPMIPIMLCPSGSLHVPALGLRASARSCAAPPASCGRSADPSCSRRG